ncbi:MAG: helix-turn-helix transcriptional regulator [Planctomycetes bacterium]|nr:helix-turn-helix transcriptional regulator [Planctomycetota bacterium]
MLPWKTLSHPVRLKLARCLAGGAPASLEELARASGAHVNTVRAHLATLEQAGLVTRGTAAPEGRGRPEARFRWAEGWSVPAADFLGLAELLAAALARARPSPAVLRAVGQEWGRYLLGRPGAYEVKRALPRVLRRVGFHARLSGLRVTLRECPCSAVSPDRPEIVCETATGVVEGVLSGAGSRLEIRGRRHEPGKRRCCLTLRKRRT